MRKVCFKLVQHCKRKQTTSQSKRNNTASRKLKSHGLDGGYLDLNKWTASASAIEQCALFEASEHSGITRCLCHLEWHWSSECHDCHMFPWKKRSTLPPRLQKKRWRPAGIQHDNPMQTYAHDKTCKDLWRYVKTNDDKLNCNDSAQSHCHDKLDTSQPWQIETFPAPPVWSSKAPSNASNLVQWSKILWYFQVRRANVFDIIRQFLLASGKSRKNQQKIHFIQFH